MADFLLTMGVGAAGAALGVLAAKAWRWARDEDFGMRGDGRGHGCDS